ncbi:putative Ig domain-containing protein [Candidatus Ulvibacter alkanivorans]|uniref:putative Ig domain-containing protein n=1 Tax=Candidatus Ulvibacter alkanivorans TaxID=2267620 RepID=UPI000DF1587A|nr:putative Ig domain-containing protein [Candidatus Ulvibacter alkanivorans]
MKFFYLKTLLILSAFALFLSCGLTDDDEDTVMSPSLTYPSTNLMATFFEAGNSEAPTISWNGNQGTLSLSSSIEGISLNSTNGVLNWNRQLAPGDYNMNVIATNSEGQTVANINLSNPFQGAFTGTYSGSFYFMFEFNSDGTLEVAADDGINPLVGSGTWELNNGVLTADYTYDSSNDEFSISGTLSQTNNQAELSGNWYFGFGAQDGNEGGEFEIFID